MLNCLLINCINLLSTFIMHNKNDGDKIWKNKHTRPNCYSHWECQRKATWNFNWNNKSRQHFVDDRHHAKTAEWGANQISFKFRYFFPTVNLVNGHINYVFFFFIEIEVVGKNLYEVADTSFRKWIFNDIRACLDFIFNSQLINVINMLIRRDNLKQISYNLMKWIHWIR